MRIRPLNDWVHIELEPEKERQTKTGIIMPGPSPVRIAKVLAVGPGRHYIDGKYIPTVVKPGDRFPFFRAVITTGSNRTVSQRLPDDQAFIRETDILFLLPEGGDLEVSV